MRAMLRRLTRAACISVHAPDGSHSYVAIFFILVLPNTGDLPCRLKSRQGVLQIGPQHVDAPVATLRLNDILRFPAWPPSAIDTVPPPASWPCVYSFCQGRNEMGSPA